MDIHLREICTHSNYLIPFGQRLVATPENSGYEMNFQETAVSGSIFAEIVWTHLLLKKILVEASWRHYMMDRYNYPARSGKKTSVV